MCYCIYDFKLNLLYACFCTEFIYFCTRIMITNLLKKGIQSYNSIPIISSIQNNQNPKPLVGTPANNMEMQKIVEQILSNLTSVLSERLGQKIDNSEFKDLTTDILKNKLMQNTLIETKQKYNDLVNRSTTLYQQARKISNSIGEFVTSINLYLESEQMMIPLKQIQKGINDLLPEKVQKQINYLIRIFENDFQTIVNKKIKIAESSLQEQIKLYKNLNKNLQSEIVSLKGSKNSEQSKYFQQTLKMNTINDKIAKLNSEKNDLEKQLKQEIANVKDREKLITENQKQINRLKAREGQLLQKIKNLQSKNHRLQRQIKQKSSQLQQLNEIVQKLKVKQEQIYEQLEAEHKKKQNHHETLRKKIYLQKSLIQQKYSQLLDKYKNLQQNVARINDEIKKLSEQNQKLKQNKYINIQVDQKNTQNTQQNKDVNIEPSLQPNDKSQKINKVTKRISVTELTAKIMDLQQKNKDLQFRLDKQLNFSVNKQVLKNLFLNYDDESKEWTIRRNIKYQIYSLLDLKDRIPKTQEVKASKWFGIF